MPGVAFHKREREQREERRIGDGLAKIKSLLFMLDKIVARIYAYIFLYFS